MIHTDGKQTIANALPTMKRKAIHGSIEECERDNEGQLVLYTGLYEWNDGTIHNKPEGE